MQVMHFYSARILFYENFIYIFIYLRNSLVELLIWEATCSILQMAKLNAHFCFKLTNILFVFFDSNETCKILIKNNKFILKFLKSAVVKVEIKNFNSQLLLNTYVRGQTWALFIEMLILLWALVISGKRGIYFHFCNDKNT